MRPSWKSIVHIFANLVTYNVENYAILAKTDAAFSRKWPKTRFFKKLLIKKISDFSAKIWLRHFSTLGTV